MLMAMLEAGGYPVLKDASRPADAHNPGGYHEYAPVRASRRNPSWVAQAAGRAVKVVAPLLPWLPADRPYRVIFIVRDVLEVAVSQRRMLEGGTLAATEADRRVAGILARQLRELCTWVRSSGHLEVLWVSHRAVLRNPAGQSERIGAWLGGGLDASAMAGVVRSGWWRNRRSHIKEKLSGICNKDLFPYIIPGTDLAVRSADAVTRDVPASAADSAPAPLRGQLDKASRT